MPNQNKQLQTRSEEELQNARYRFSGYVLPKLQLDETGASYPIVSPHPYFYNQPEYWQAGVMYGHPGGTDNAAWAIPVPGGAGSLYPFVQNGENT